MSNLENISGMIPEIIHDNRIAQSEEEVAYLALVRLCHAQGEWYPGVTLEQCYGISVDHIRRPDADHPVLSEPKYHRYNATEEPLNKRGRRKLNWMRYKYDRTILDHWDVHGSGMICDERGN